MFAVREVPEASTGFSPFELLYSHKPRGLLDLAKESWKNQPCPHHTIIEHVEAMKDRVATIYPIVREHMEKAQKEQQASYNRPAQPREFKLGDRVLVLVPTVPTEITERVGEVNCRTDLTREPAEEMALCRGSIQLFTPERLRSTTK